jgi:hypothetical protein
MKFPAVLLLGVLLSGCCMLVAADEGECIQTTLTVLTLEVCLRLKLTHSELRAGNFHSWYYSLCYVECFEKHDFVSSC